MGPAEVVPCHEQGDGRLEALDGLGKGIHESAHAPDVLPENPVRALDMASADPERIGSSRDGSSEHPDHLRCRLVPLRPATLRLAEYLDLLSEIHVAPE